MSEPLTITTERVDDLPLLVAQMEQMDLPNLLDSHFRVNGNWQGLSPGWVTTVWLAHLLSQADHRLSYVQPWAAARLHSLTALVAQPVRALDFSDDRLAWLLDAFSDDARWVPFEATLNRRLLRVDDLHHGPVRLDTTTASGYWQITDDGLFPFGHSKDHRPDLPQVKVLLAALDPLALPLVTDVLGGQRADDPLYLPAIARVRRALGRQGGLLFIGDSKLGALATRAGVEAGGDYYLCPLGDKQLPPDWPTVYLTGVRAGTQALTTITRQRADGTSGSIAEGYECIGALETTIAGQPVAWMERRLVVRSRAGAQSAERQLHERLAAAEAALGRLGAQRGPARLRDRAALDTAVAEVLGSYPGADLLTVTVTETGQERAVRGYKERPARTARRWAFTLQVARDATAVAARIASLGWRVYATNAPAADFGLEAAMRAYRDEYLIEHSFGRLKGAPLSLAPCYLQRDAHVVGLGRLLAVGLRVLSLVEFVARRQLEPSGSTLAGLYKGQPRQATARPTAERLPAQFEGVTLAIIAQAGQRLYYVTPLSDLQQRILALLGFPEMIYTKLAADLSQPP
jgi:transposase